MTEYNIQQAMERIEGKLDQAISDHGERIASLETTVTDVKQDIHDEKIHSWVKMGGAYLLAVASHLGLWKLGVK
jgi:hypothetical protein